MHPRIAHRAGPLQPDAAPPGSRSRNGARWASEARNPVAHRITSAATSRPSSQATPRAVIRSNTGRRSSTPRSRAARTASVAYSPVTPTTLCGGSPRRTRSSTRATAARPSSASKASSRKTGGRRVTQVVAAATSAISISNWTAEVPPPTTTTRAPANSSGPR